MNGHVQPCPALVPEMGTNGGSLEIPASNQLKNTKKRRLEDEGMVADCCSSPYDGCSSMQQKAVPRSFLPLTASGGVYQTEAWQGADTLYHPLSQDTLLNTRLVEQFTFSSGMHFVADAAGNYCATMAGSVIHLWRHNPKTLKLDISRSFFFTDRQLFEEARNFLLQL